MGSDLGELLVLIIALVTNFDMVGKLKFLELFKM